MKAPHVLRDAPISVGTPPKTLTRNGLLNVQDVARELGMSVRWMQERVRLNQIPHYRFGRTVRFDLADVWAWMQRFRAGDGNGVAGRGR